MTALLSLLPVAGCTTRIERGRAALEDGQGTEAIYQFTRAIEGGKLSRTDLATAYRGRGLAHHRMGDVDKAIADYTRAIKVKPDDAKAYFGRGLGYKANGALDKALADLSKVIELNPEFAPAYEKRSVIYEGRGQDAEAEADRLKAAKLYRTQP